MAQPPGETLCVLGWFSLTLDSGLLLVTLNSFLPVIELELLLLFSADKIQMQIYFGTEIY